MANKPISYIFRPYITKGGRRIYRKGGGVFKIPVYDVRQLVLFE